MLSRLILIGGLSIVALTVSVYAYSSWKESRGRQNLVQARDLLEKLVSQPEGREWTASADRAEQLLKSTEGTSSERSAHWLIMGLARLRGTRVSMKELDRDTVRCNTADVAVASLLFFRAGDVVWAEKLAYVAIDRGDERPRALKAATILYYHLGRDEDTKRYATEWSKLEPRDPLPWQYLAYVAEDRGFSNEAVEALRKQIDCTSGPVDDPRRRLVMHLVKMGNTAEARAEFDKLESGTKSSSSESHLIEAQLLFQEGKLKEVEQILDQTKFTGQALTDSKLLRAKLLMEQSQFDTATTELRECIIREPANQDAHYLLGQALARAGKSAEAKVQLEKHRELLDLKVRINTLERQAGHERDNVAVRLTLADLYRKIGLTEQAKHWSDSARNAQSSRSK
jgi:tetratricopeptide (TPR) repeat protein